MDIEKSGIREEAKSVSTSGPLVASIALLMILAILAVIIKLASRRNYRQQVEAFSVEESGISVPPPAYCGQESYNKELLSGIIDYERDSFGKAVVIHPPPYS